jgi:hypothetical protein
VRDATRARAGRAEPFKRWHPQLRSAAAALARGAWCSIHFSTAPRNRCSHRGEALRSARTHAARPLSRRERARDHA